MLTERAEEPMAQAMPLPPRRFTLEEYREIRDPGRRDDGPRDGFLEGWIATKTTQGPHHPTGEEIGLLIEVADSSPAGDRRKSLIGADAGIPNYWIVSLIDRQVEAFRNPLSKRGSTM